MVTTKTIRVFVDPDYLAKHLPKSELDILVAAFKRFKTGERVDIFGKDRYYDEPGTFDWLEEHKVRHVHLRASGSSDYTSDVALVYCEGRLEEDCYLLIAILKPDAHKKAWKRNIMWPLAEIARIFRKNN